MTHDSAIGQGRNTDAKLRVVLFTGGRGSHVLSHELVKHPRIDLTLAINGYDDGASTGEIRRFLRDCLGPSDFRKNASWLARELGSCDQALIDLVDTRLRADCSVSEARHALASVREPRAHSAAATSLTARARDLDAATLSRLSGWLSAFERELDASDRPFDFSDCSIGNLVFAGAFLRAGRRFPEALDAYCALLGLPPGLIDNVTDGTNAHLVALDLDGHLVASEGEIVDARRHSRVGEIYLIGHPFTPTERHELTQAGAEVVLSHLRGREVQPALNPRLAERLRTADLIIYAPGTQHSSLFPSYLTVGLSQLIARNLQAIKLLITNIQTDAEIANASAVDIVERAVYYLKERGRLHMPTPCLITHCILNDPRSETDAPYVPLGQLERLEDPRLVRIGAFEDGVTGRHDAGEVLTPFLESFLLQRRAVRVAVLLYDADSVNKLCQSLVEMVRGGIRDTSAEIVVFHDREDRLDAAFLDSLPFTVRTLTGSAMSDARFRDVLTREGFDYVLLFESSGMYRGEDIATLAAALASGRLDAVWGSRRLSVRDIHESYRMRYRHQVVLGAMSYLGSHLLSLAYLVLYGRYISDTLSGVRAVRALDVCGLDAGVTHSRVNQYLLSGLLRRRAELLEIPVPFFPLSPERVRRTTVWDGIRALAAIVHGRFRRRAAAEGPVDVADRAQELSSRS